MRKFLHLISDKTEEDYLYEIIDYNLKFILGGDYYHCKPKAQIDGFFKGIDTYDKREIAVSFTDEDEDIYLEDTNVFILNNKLRCQTVFGECYDFDL